MADYGPSLKVCRLYKKTSAKGAVYFQGRIGNLKMVVLKSKDTADDGTEIWDVLYSQAPDNRSRDSASSSQYASPSQPAQKPSSAKPYVDKDTDIDIPF